MAKLLLFDIDGTLVLTGGAGSRALKLAFAELFGIEDGFAGVSLAGRTDTSIFRQAARVHGLGGDPQELLARFKDAYHRHLEALLPVAAREGGGRVLPGVRELLEALSGRREVVLGLATGNFCLGAALKLGYYGLGHYFRDGGYGDDSEDRAQLVGVAIERLARHAADGARQAYVVGDTPLDVEAAKAAGAYAVAVATGSSSEAELRECGADLVLTDLSQWPDLWQRLFATP